jgi:DNA-directed RNA polymerase specialized sigma24 family protein
MRISRFEILQSAGQILQFLVHLWPRPGRSAIRRVLTPKSGGDGYAEQCLNDDLQSAVMARNGTTSLAHRAPSYDEGAMRLRLLRLHAAVEALPEPGRSIFKDHCLDGLPYVDIARRRGMTVTQVQLEFANAMVALTAEDMDDHHD